MGAMDGRPTLLFGKFGDEARAQLEAATTQASCLATHVQSIDEALAWLEENGGQALVCRTDDGEQLVVRARSLARFSRLPVLAVSETLNDLSFITAYSWGADDVVSIDQPRPLSLRLRSLPKQAPPPPQETRGPALVAEADRTRRAAVARILRNAGFSVRFAASEEDTRTFARDANLTLIVATTELVPQVAAFVAEARSDQSKARVVMCCPPRQMKAERASLAGVTGVTITDGFAAPENVLFAANELLTVDRSSGRTSARVAHGTAVSFRGAGRELDEQGFTYNVSAKGLYVRTMAPPEDDEAWLELWPPRLDRRVRLVGRVAWRRPFGYSEMATVPPGFGVEIVDGAKKDLALWADGYERLLEAVG
jgi:DNA-binding response OmpR family regulator